DRPLDDVDRAVDAGAESPRVGEQHLHHALTLLAERLSRQASISSASAPTVMAESATLNAGKYACPQCTWMKSTTRPDVSRSIMLPSAPPRMSASPQASSPCVAARSRRSHTMRPALTPSASTTNSQRCQPDASDSTLKAAPVL